MKPEQADAYAASAGAYIHIPFCSEVCPYCDFAVVAGRDDEAERYARAVVAEIDRSPIWRPLDSVYFGGGTPSHVDSGLLFSMLEALADKHGISADAEVSLEANPEDFDIQRARNLFDAGFNRVSFGAQSFDPGVLASLGRRHGPSQIASSVEAARSAGLENVSVDLIYGTAEESESSWLRSLQSAVDLDVPHVSAYALTVERGTPLSREIAAGKPAPDPDIQVHRYEVATGMLGQAGLERYEVSNWAVPGHECAYNLTVWAQGEFVAYGNGAHGFREGERFRNVRRLDAYIERVEEGSSPRSGGESITGWDAEVDRLFVGLRRAVGVAEGAGTAALLDSEAGQILVGRGIIASEAGRLRVVDPLLTDAVLRSILALPAPIVIGHGHA